MTERNAAKVHARIRVASGWREEVGRVVEGPDGCGFVAYGKDNQPLMAGESLLGKGVAPRPMVYETISEAARGIREQWAETRLFTEMVG